MRWRLVIHGGIDGYSRLVLSLHCSDNNMVTTVLERFQKAVEMYSLPSQVRTDQGLENIEVAKLMLVQRGCGHGSLLVHQISSQEKDRKDVEKPVYCCCSTVQAAVLLS